MSPKFWLFDYLSKATEMDATTLPVGCWHVWDARNDARNNNSELHPQNTSVKIIAYIQMIVQHCYKPKPGTRRESSKAQKWTPPPPGEVLVNVDAALFPERRGMAMGAVLRDSCGTCLAAASEPLVGFTHPGLVEALELRRAMEITMERGYVRVIFASDCLSLIQRIS
jgi:hypothetical protein